MHSDSEKIRLHLLDGGDLCASSFTSSDLLDYWNTDFASNPLSGRFIVWVWQEAEISFNSDLINQLLMSCPDPGAFSTLTNMLSNSQISIADFNGKYVSTLFAIIKDPLKFHGLRGQALRLISIVALESPATLRLIRSYFFNIDTKDDVRYLEYVAAAVGLISSHVKLDEAEEHLKLLIDEAEVTEEASLQLGFLYVSKSLCSSDRTDVLKFFEKACKNFEVAFFLGEGRTDAQLMYQCLTILLKFQNGVKSQLKDNLLEFNETIFEYSALLLHAEKTDRLTGSRSEEYYRWMLFSSRLSMLCESFEQVTWLEAARVIEEELFFIYSAQRSIFRHDNNLGISRVIKPVIIDEVQKNSFYLASIKAWLEVSKNEGLEGELQELYELVITNLEVNVFRSADDLPVDPRHAFSNIKEELTRFSNGADWLTEQFSECKSTFEAQLPSPAVTDIKNKLLAFLQSCSESDDILNHQDARNLFFSLFDRTIAFVRARIQMPSSKISAKKYLLFDFEEAVKEEHLQDDLFTFLQTGIFSANVNYEPRKHAGGRSDIKVTYMNVNTVMELKKIDVKMTDEEILNKYGPQASTYQVADTNFCFLGVLDNYDNGGIQPDLRDCMSCHHWTPEDGMTKYSVVLFRIQGKRRPPSYLSR